MRNRGVVLGIAAAVLVVVLWWMFVFSGIRSDTDDVKDEIEAARREESSLRAQLDELEAIEEQGPEIAAQLAELEDALPQYPDLAEFVTEANAIAESSGITWLSIAPSEPVPVGTIGEIGMNIQVQGGYFQVLDYLNRLEEIDRLVVVDSITLNAGDGTEAGSGTGGDTGGDLFVGGAPQLSAALTARMFTLSTSTVDPGASATSTTVAGDTTDDGTDTSDGVDVTTTTAAGG